jgi:hypothetical protein
VLTLQHLRGAAGVDMEPLSLINPLHILHMAAGEETNTLALKHHADRIPHFRFIVWQQEHPPLEDRDLATEMPEKLSEFEGDIPDPDNHQ